MYKYSYDLHIHSCLSPCGDGDMTPNNISNMAAIKNLDIIALSDHNTAKNTIAVRDVIKRENLPIIFIPAIEVTTAEDIHVVVYFPDCESAEAFENEILIPRRSDVKNRPDIFGEQIIMNPFDEEIGREENLLINAADISVDEIKGLAESYFGAAIPAHIDKDANSLLASLGMYPSYIGFDALEIKKREKIESLTLECGFTREKILINSDAHFLWDIKEDGDPLASEKEISSPRDFLSWLK